MEERLTREAALAIPHEFEVDDETDPNEALYPGDLSTPNDYVSIYHDISLQTLFVFDVLTPLTRNKLTSACLPYDMSSTLGVQNQVDHWMQRHQKNLVSDHGANTIHWTNVKALVVVVL